MARRPLTFRILPDPLTPNRHVARTMGYNVGTAVNKAGYLVFRKRGSVSV